MPDLFVLPLIPNIFPCFEGGTNLFLGNLLIYVKMFGLRQDFSVRIVLFSLPLLLKLATIIGMNLFFNLMSSTNGTQFLVNLFLVEHIFHTLFSIWDRFLFKS